MAEGRVFFDTNVLLYLLSGDQAKADRAEEVLADGGVVSVQVLNEFVSVATRKLAMKWPEIRECLEPLRAVLDVQPVNVETHDKAIDLAEHSNIAFYDALIISAAQIAGCDLLLSEDLQHGRVFGKTLTVRNPFRR
jgi:predicted nucleic acid-binding protein